MTRAQASRALRRVAEAVRESDIAKLSFSVQLAEGLFSQQQQHHHHQQQPGRSAAEQQGAGDGGQQDSVGLSGSFEPGAMIWLIQRDFLQGSGGAQQAVKEALALVPNPTVRRGTCGRCAPRLEQSLFGSARRRSLKSSHPCACQLARRRRAVRALAPPVRHGACGGCRAGSTQRARDVGGAAVP